MKRVLMLLVALLPLTLVADEEFDALMAQYNKALEQIDAARDAALEKLGQQYLAELGKVGAGFRDRDIYFEDAQVCP